MVICSPTATGKTSLAIELAEASGGEIVNADSLQVYRYLNIGTAKPTREERARVPHHLIDVVDPDEEFNAAIYAGQARAVIDRLADAGKPVFVVGGTGLYIRALLQGIIETPPVDENIRNYYKGLRDRFGRQYIYGLLEQKTRRRLAASTSMTPCGSSARWKCWIRAVSPSLRCSEIICLRIVRMMCVK